MPVPGSIGSTLPTVQDVDLPVIEVAPPYDPPAQITSLLAANIDYEMLAPSAIPPR